MVSKKLLAMMIGTRLGRWLSAWAWPHLSLATVCAAFKTPALIEAYMRRCFTYARDAHVHGVDEHWQAPQRTFATRRGDCEDFALFAWLVLRQQRAEAHVFCAFTDTAGHAVCLCRHDGIYWTLANDGLRRVGAFAPATNEQASLTIARRAAEVLYPSAWTSCSFVTHVELLGSAHERELLPIYEWIYPHERPFELQPAHPSAAQPRALEAEHQAWCAGC